MTNTKTNRETVHQTSRAEDLSAESRKTPDFSKFNRNDSYKIPSIDTGKDRTGTDSGSPKRLSKNQLTHLDTRLSGRDKDILFSIQSYRYLMSRQIQRLLFTDAATPSAALRATNRNLKKLKELGLITSLSRRIGGVRSGSGSYTWHLTHAGERLLRLHGETRSSSTQFDPSPYFLAHTLAVAEAAIQLTEISRKSQMELKSLQAEPECWRSYSEYGTLVSLKPDLYAITISGEYEDRYFLEVDLSTESIARIIEKCGRYHKYYLSGIEQEITGVFPLTVWIVPTENRKNKLIESLKPAFDKRPKLFAVITTNELEHLICDGGDNRMLC